jgi:hypothetical protein
MLVYRTLASVIRSLVRVSLVSTVTGIPPSWQGMVDDAAIFPPGDAPLPDAVSEHLRRRGEWYAGLVGAFVIGDLRLPDLLDVLDEGEEPDPPLPVTVVVTGGAGAVVPAAKWASGSGQLRLAGLETALRDLDDLPGNARRVCVAVDRARADGALDDETPVHVELPHVGSTAGWLAAADVVAEHELRLKFRTGGVEADLFPHAHALVGWIDAALDRETAFKCTAGLHNAVRHTGETGFEHHGFLNVLVATRALFDGASREEAVAVLEERDGTRVAALVGELDVPGTRRWFTSFGSCSVDEPLEDMVELELLAGPR